MNLTIPDDELSRTILQYLPFIIPFVVINLGLLIFSWIDLLRKKRTRNLNVLIWFLITFINTIGPVLYLALGRAESADSDEEE